MTKMTTMTWLLILFFLLLAGTWTVCTLDTTTRLMSQECINLLPIFPVSYNRYFFTRKFTSISNNLIVKPNLFSCWLFITGPFSSKQSRLPARDAFTRIYDLCWQGMREWWPPLKSQKKNSLLSLSSCTDVCGHVFHYQVQLTLLFTSVKLKRIENMKWKLFPFYFWSHSFLLLLFFCVFV